MLMSAYCDQVEICLNLYNNSDKLICFEFFYAVGKSKEDGTLKYQGYIAGPEVSPKTKREGIVAYAESGKKVRVRVLLINPETSMPDSISTTYYFTEEESSRRLWNVEYVEENSIGKIIVR